MTESRYLIHVRMVESPGDRVLVLFSCLGFNTGVFPDTWVPFWDLLKLGMTLLGDTNRGPGPLYHTVNPSARGSGGNAGRAGTERNAGLGGWKCFFDIPRIYRSFHDVGRGHLWLRYVGLALVLQLCLQEKVKDDVLQEARRLHWKSLPMHCSLNLSGPKP